MQLLSGIGAWLARSLRRRGKSQAASWAFAAALACPATGLAADELRPEQTAVASIQTPLDQSIPLSVEGDVSKVVVSQPDTIDVEVSGPNSLHLIGRNRGTTNLLVYDPAGRLSQSIDVQVGYDARGLRDSLAAALPDERIDVTSLASGLVLDGEVSTAGAADIALLLANKTAPDAIFSRLRVRSNQVSLDVRILEVSSRRLQDIGSELNVSDGAHVALRAGSGLLGAESPEGTAALRLTPGRYRLDATLRALESQGVLEVMAQPTLTAISGGSARFHAGGEFPYPIPGTDGAPTLQFKTYGTTLAFRPDILPNGLIRLELEAELSEVDPAVGLRLGGFVVPGILVRRALTTVEIQDGESYLVAGLFSETHRELVRGIPILNDVPVLGPLVRALLKEEERRELAVIVTPRIVRADAQREAVPLSLTDTSTPPAVSAPRGPPHRALVRQIRRIVAPPVRWAKRIVMRAMAQVQSRA